MQLNIERQHNVLLDEHLALTLDCDALYLKALVGGAAAGTAGALDSDRGCSFCITHLQERGEHAPPEHTHAHTNTHSQHTAS